MSETRSRLQAIKKDLGPAWSAFFLRHGRFTPIQEAAMPAILAGRNVVVAAPTAGGKTEAAIAPLAARKRSGADSGWTLVVSPTRALVNDLYRRLLEPLAQIGLRLARRTGDHPSFDAKSPGDFVITTPESLDALLGRTPKSFASTSSMVIDELHLFDGTPRGDQLRILCRRVDRVRRRAIERGDQDGEPVQFVALSATLNDPLASARRYFTDPVLATAGEGREIEADYVPMSSPSDILTYLRACAPVPRKVLVFTRSRREAEAIAAALHGCLPYAPNTFVHHGSLSKGQREDVERRFEAAPAGVCVATTTLELGIDIGDIDLVFLVRPPHSISSLLQRVGRGCRRAGNRTPAACAYVDDGDRLWFEAAVAGAQRGDVEPIRSVFRPSVVLQQMASYMKQRSGTMEASTLRSLFEDLGGQDDTVVQCLLSRLAELPSRDFVHVQPAGRLSPGEQMLELHESSRLFANFSSNPGVDEVRDRTTGALLGHANIERDTAQIAFAGASRKVVSARGRRVEVEGGGSEGPAELPRFPARAAPVSGHLCGVVRKHLGIGERQVPKLRLPGGELAYFWFLGSFEARLAAESLGLSGKATPIVYASHEDLSASDFGFSQERMEDAARESWAALEHQLEAGAPTFKDLLPDEVRREWVALTARGTGLWAWSARVELLAPDRETATRLRALL